MSVCVRRTLADNNNNNNNNGVEDQNSPVRNITG